MKSNSARRRRCCNRMTSSRAASTVSVSVWSQGWLWRAPPWRSRPRRTSCDARLIAIGCTTSAPQEEVKTGATHRRASVHPGSLSRTELTSHVDTVVFANIGTLPYGVPTVTDGVPRPASPGTRCCGGCRSRGAVRAPSGPGHRLLRQAGGARPSTLCPRSAPYPRRGAAATVGGEELAATDAGWLEQLVSRRMPLSNCPAALERREDDVKVLHRPRAVTALGGKSPAPDARRNGRRGA